MKRQIRVSGVGCCLVDRLYNDISFTSASFSPYLRESKGDGGLFPGRLVFKEEFERYCNRSLPTVLENITDQKEPGKLNIGGPCIVPLIHASQLLYDIDSVFYFYGYRGDDDDGNFLLSMLKRTPVKTTNYKVKKDATPSTIVFSDPKYNKGGGERIFINQLGAATGYSPDDLNDDFFNSDIAVFGGTALVPQIHDNLTELLQKAKSRNTITIVNTVYDYRNEKLDPIQRWPLGKSDDSYKYIDLLIADKEESLRLSGEKNIPDALKFFKKKGAGAAIVTSGSEDIHFYSGGSVFHPVKPSTLPVSDAIAEKIKNGARGDTTGCGDNFVGGAIASVVEQLYSRKEKINLLEACILGVVSGGFACLYIGGTYFESRKGEKRDLLTPYYKEYQEQLEK